MIDKVIIYVEGPGDKLSMELLLETIIQKAASNGIAITFHEAPRGDKKKSLIEKIPKKAANILLNDNGSVVAVIPDLHPKDKVFPHKTYQELSIGIFDIFKKILIKKHPSHDKRLYQRFKIFCFKHDLEALLLAAHEQLSVRLTSDLIPVTWCIPVEDQNHNGNHPKKIIENLFKSYGQFYKDTYDAPIILGNAPLKTITTRCPECFKPFVDYLESLC